MMKTSLTTSFLLVLFSAVFFIAPAFAQRPSCDLQLMILDVDTEAHIEDAAGTALDLDTKKSVKAVLKNGMLYFAGLTELDQYKITITRAGFKRTIDERVMTCVDLVDGAVSNLVYMKKGSSKQTFSAGKARPIAAFPIGEPIGAPADLQAPAAPPAPLSPPVPKIVSKGVVNGSALVLARPEYPSTAKAMGVTGVIQVQVLIDEEGNVISATVLKGHPLLRTACVDAAKASKFKPTLLQGRPVKVSGIIIYSIQ